MVNRILILIALVVFAACQTKETTNEVSTREIKGPKTTDVILSSYGNILYVNNSLKANGDGSKEKPFNSIKNALQSINSESVAILISAGRYTEELIVLNDNISLYGGYSSDFNERNISVYKAIISGNNKNRIIECANNNTIDGFTFTEGVVKGKGGAIYIDNKQEVILSNNEFIFNKTLKPAPWNPKYWHETANDGGAVYCSNESEVTLQNNFFAKNKTENGRGAGFAADNKCKVKLIDNIFFNNFAGLDDPMRSSDGGAISIFDWCDTEIIGNMILSNTAGSNNDAGGIFIALWSSARIEENIFVDNEAYDDAGALFVGGQEHRYDAPLDPIPPKDQFYVSIKNNRFVGNRNSSLNSGAMRFTMESRGDFVKNIVAQNNGVYFQRSEVKVTENIILDNFLFIETKEGLELGTIENNIIWGDYDRQVDATVKNNNMKSPEEGNYYKQISFIDDAIDLKILSSNWLRATNETNIIVNHRFNKNELANRIVRVGKKWGVIKSNDIDSIILLGNFTAVNDVHVLSTYTLAQQQ